MQPCTTLKIFAFYFQIMLLCWDKDPSKRPTFETLHNDFSDFESTVEAKYDYDPNIYKRENDYTSDPTALVKTRARGNRGRGGQRAH